MEYVQSRVTMPAADPRIRTITIKTGVVKRLSKEKCMYEKEAKQMEQKIETMKAGGEDEYNIKKQVEVKNESLAMIPDCKRRLNTAYQELVDLLEKEQDLVKTAEYISAQEVLENASENL